MANDITVKHGWILLLFVSLYITKRSEAVLLQIPAHLTTHSAKS